MAGTDDLRWLLIPSRGGSRRGRSSEFFFQRRNEANKQKNEIASGFGLPNNMQGVAQGQQPGADPAGSAGVPPGAIMAPHQQMVQKNNMLNCNPNPGPTPPGYPTGYAPQQARSQMYAGYYQQPKTHTPPIDSMSVRSTMPNNIPVHPDVQLKKLPFYDHMAELLKPSTLMPTGTARMQDQSFIFHLTPQQANDIAMNRDIGLGAKTDYIVQVQMRFCLLETSCEQEDFFPPGIAVKVNGKLCPLPNPIPTNRPGVEPKRPPRPVNISSLIRISPTVANHVQVSWAAEYGRGYVIALNLVRKLTSSQLLHRLKTRGVRHADYTTGLIKEKLREDADSEIATTSLRVSLMCPLGKMRMSIPCRPTTCTHLQCFDANLYLQMNERKPTWTCPVCDKPGLFEKLVIDGYFQDVLSGKNLPSDGNEIELHQDGSWSISSVKKDDKPDNATPPPVVKNRGGPPEVTATVEIADDEVVPVVSDGEDKEKEREKNKQNDQPKEAEGSEPPKAPKVVVDLTLSDDDDEVAPPTTNGPSKPDSNKSANAEVTSNTAPSGTTPGYISPNIITLDSPSPPSSPVHPPTSRSVPPTQYSGTSHNTPALPPFFNLETDSSSDYHVSY